MDLIRVGRQKYNYKEIYSTVIKILVYYDFHILLFVSPDRNREVEETE